MEVAILQAEPEFMFIETSTSKNEVTIVKGVDNI